MDIFNQDSYFSGINFSWASLLWMMGDKLVKALPFGTGLIVNQLQTNCKKDVNQWRDMKEAAEAGRDCFVFG